MGDSFWGAPVLWRFVAAAEPEQAPGSIEETAPRRVAPLLPKRKRTGALQNLAAFAECFDLPALAS